MKPPQAVVAARNAMHKLTVAIHYASCKGRVAGRLSAA
jgi:hypothetical protein